jgi:cobalt/nickel transport system permease protein
VHADPFDRYRAGDSAVHRADARVKLLLALVFALSNLLLPDGAWIAFGLSLGLVVVATLLADLEPLFALKRSLIALPFALAAAAVVFNVPGQALASWQVGPWLLEPTDAGAVRFVSIVTRSLLSVMGVVLLGATTPFPDIAHALRHLRVPASLVAVLAFGYRYLFVLTDEALRLMRARDARRARPAGGAARPSPMWHASVAGHMAGQLFVRSLDRAERVHQAMVARGYTGHLPTLRRHQVRRVECLAFLVVLALLAALQASARMAGP